MQHGTIPINKDYELEYRYHEKDTAYKYFNRKFEVYLLEKKSVKKHYLMHMDNTDISEGQWFPHIYKATTKHKKHDFGITTLNWNDIKTHFMDYVVDEIGEKHRTQVKKAVSKLSSPKI
jgi:hypothetical protein